MKVLFIGAHFPRPNNPTIGVWALAQAHALRSAGHDVHVISPVPNIPAFVTTLMRRGSSSQCPKTHDWDGIMVDYVRWPLYPVGPMAKYLRSRPDIWVSLAWHLSSRKFLKLAEHFAPTVIYAHHGQLGGYVAAQLSRLLKIPFIITEHAFGDIESCAENQHRKRHYDRIVKTVSAWIAVSNRMKESMLGIFPKAPAVTVHNGGDAVQQDLQNASRPGELRDCVIVLSVSFLYKRKRVPLLIESFDAIAGKYPRARLLIVGNGDDYAAVEAAAKGAVHTAQIILLGHLEHQQALQYTVWCDVLANIAINEPFGTVFSDAMMAGKPIVFSTDCGINDVAQDGVHGLAVVPNSLQSAFSALDRLIGDAELRAKLGAAAAATAHSQLTWARNASRMTELFEAALQTYKSNAASKNAR